MASSEDTPLVRTVPPPATAGQTYQQQQGPAVAAFDPELAAAFEEGALCGLG